MVQCDPARPRLPSEGLAVGGRSVQKEEVLKSIFSVERRPIEGLMRPLSPIQQRRHPVVGSLDLVPRFATYTTRAVHLKH